MRGASPLQACPDTSGGFMGEESSLAISRDKYADT